MKISIQEYSSGMEIDAFLSPNTTYKDLTDILSKANLVIKKSLNLKNDTLVISGGRIRALGIAGAIRLSKDIELEIVPKMLIDESNENWKETLFLLAALSRHGDIISNEHIHSNTAYKDSLYDIAGRILAREYSLHRRKPIRQYHRDRFWDYAIDGDIDFERIMERNPDGIPQTKVSFDIINPYNATIQKAMTIVLPFIKDTSTRRIITQAIQELRLQKNTGLSRLRVPSRNKEWAQIYNLSYDICSGMGSSLDNGDVLSPSFIVDTWKIWEWLVTIAAKIGFGNRFKIVPQASMPFGIKKYEGKSGRVNVFPDVAIGKMAGNHFPEFLIDAKYKVLPDDDNIKIEREDLYEAYAFCQAAKVKKIVLAYPAPIQNNAVPGSTSIALEYNIDDIVITVVKIAFGTISKQGDIAAFCRQLSRSILEITS